MGRARVDLEHGMWHQPRRRPSGRIDRHDLVVVAVDHQQRHVDGAQVPGEIGLGKRLDAVVGVLVAGQHALHPERVDHSLRGLGAGAVEAEERAAGEIAVQLRAVGDRRGANAIEDVDGQPSRVGCRLEHEGRDGGDQRRPGEAATAVPADVACDFAAAGREPDQRGRLQIQRVEKRRQIVGIRVHLVAVPRLVGTAVPAAIVRDDAVAMRRQEEHLRFPAVGVERPAVAEHHCRPCPPVLVVNPGPVGRRDRRHSSSPFLERNRVTSSSLPGAGQSADDEREVHVDG